MLIDSIETIGFPECPTLCMLDFRILGKYAKSGFLMALLIPLNLGVNAASAQAGRWTEQKANDWYGRQPWLVGSNYVPKSAINQLEMWQKETFDSAEFDKEMGWAEAMGLNRMRVFLHDLLWERDSVGFQNRN